MNIWYLSPYALDLNIGKSYNEQICLLPADSTICIRDHDTILFPNAGNHIPAIIEANPRFDIITCLTNRVGVGLHCVPGMFDVDSILEHQNKAAQLWSIYGTETIATGVAPGFCMIFHKSVWERVGGFTENSIFFDREFSNAVRKWGRIGLAKGLYILHLYRYNKASPKNSIQHLLK